MPCIRLHSTTSASNSEGPSSLRPSGTSGPLARDSSVCTTCVAIRSGLPTILTDTIVVTAVTSIDGLSNLLLQAPYTSVTDARELLSADLTGVFVPRKDPFTTLDTGAAQDQQDTAMVLLRSDTGQALVPAVTIHGVNYASLYDAVRATDEASDDDPDHATKCVALARAVKATFRLDLGLITSATNINRRPEPRKAAS
ncbi:hypothetical protein PLESTB_001323900 [Pleodorina starrii]|uniref:Uncharacterized protein n=1 Tax=Pleodorina starrii TaxID=330485 RepID=A0A9W6BU10_9CHLO|nr:hypothetical protein PLESTB_001323900 [Pleodorina starrii]